MSPARRTIHRRRVMAVTVAVTVVAATLLLVGSTAVQARVGASAAAAAATGGTLRVAMVMDPGPFVGFDPAEAFSTSETEVLSCCLQRTLMAYPGLPGYQGVQAHPDLADGPPDVSADGLTWTFHIRPGVHYATPLEHTEITSEDFARSLERAARMEHPPYALQGLLAGFSEFQSGETDTISGVLTPEPLTLQLTLLHPEPDLDQVLALPWSAPVPPGLDEKLLAPTGGALPPGGTDGGYGVFQSATGPYMFEGADQLDYADPGPAAPPAGYDEPGVTADGSSLVGGSFALVRNPSWQQDQDPVRTALPDRIDITIETQADAYAGVLTGEFDTVLGTSPQPDQLAQFTTAGQRDRVTRLSGNGSEIVTFNQTVPPFNDPAMRRAFAAALDAGFVARELNHQYDAIRFGPPPTHLIPDPLIDDMLAHWTGPPRLPAEHGPRAGVGEPTAPCPGRSCPVVTFGAGSLQLQEGPATREVARALRVIGLHPRFVPVSPRLGEPGPAGRRAYHRTWCLDPANGFAACLTGWQAPLPNAAAMIDGLFATNLIGGSATGMGMTPRALSGVGPGPVASVEQQQTTCLAMLSTQAAPCWARLDQWLTDRVVAAVPVAALLEVRVAGDRVQQYSVDQANLEVALDRVLLAPTAG